MPDPPWKRVERQTAKALGGRRNLRGGDFSKSAPDVAHPLLSVEVKYRKRLPYLLRKGLEQAAAYDAAKIPALVVKERYQHGSLIVLRLSDFEELFGAAGGGSGNMSVACTTGGEHDHKTKRF